MSTERWMDKEAVVHITMEYYSAIKKEQNWVICSDVDEPRAYHIE